MEQKADITVGPSKVLSLKTQESGVARRHIRVGQVESHSRQVGEAKQEGAGRVHDGGDGADGEQKNNERIYCPGLIELELPVYTYRGYKPHASRQTDAQTWSCLGREPPETPTPSSEETVKTPATEKFSSNIKEMVGEWESMERAVLKEMTVQDGDGQDGELRRGGQGGGQDGVLRRGAQGDGGGEHGLLRVRPGVGRIARTSREFEALRMRFEKKDIVIVQPHSMKHLKTFKDILSNTDRGHPSAKRQLMPKKKTFPFTTFTNEVTNGISADSLTSVISEKVTNKKRGICTVWCGVGGDEVLTPGKRRK